MISRRKMIAAFISAMLLTSTTTFAVPSNNTSQYRNISSGNLSELQKNKNVIETEIEQLDNKIENIIIEIEKNKKDLEKTQQDMINIKLEIAKTEKDVQTVDELFRQRVRAMYINGMDGYLEILGESKGLSDFISRLDMVSRVVNYDSKVIRELKEKKVALDKSKKSLEEKSNKIIALKIENEKKLSSMNENKKKQMELIAKINRQQNSLRSEIAMETSVPRTETIRPSRGGGYSYNSSGYTSDDSGVLNYAYKFLGVPYVWGGTSPSGFDCSGFTQYVYSNFGVSLGRTTYDQINSGSTVSRSQLNPGDLVFFGSAGNPHHVGIYVGNNSYVHAPRTGEVVKVSPMTRSDFIMGRRVK